QCRYSEALSVCAGHSRCILGGTLDGRVAGGAILCSPCGPRAAVLRRAAFAELLSKSVSDEVRLCGGVAQRDGFPVAGGALCALGTASAGGVLWGALQRCPHARAPGGDHRLSGASCLATGVRFAEDVAARCQRGGPLRVDVHVGGAYRPDLVVSIARH